MDYTVHVILQARILEWRNTGYSFPSPGDLPNPGIEPMSPTLQVDSLPAESQGSPRILEWVTYAFSRGSSPLRNQTGVSCTAGGFFTNSAFREPYKLYYFILWLGSLQMVIAAMKLKDAYSLERKFANRDPSSQVYDFSSGHVWM